MTYLNRLHVHISGNPVFTSHLGAVLSQSQILGHDAVRVDGLDTCLLQCLGESSDFWRVVELCTVSQTSSPGEDGCHWVGGSFVALLEFSVVSGDGS